MTSPILYFIRHGQTDWNAERRLQGQKDIPINELGRKQSAANGRLLLSEISDDVDSYQFVASPLLRARQSMTIIRETMGLTGPSFSTDEALREISFGQWEGFTIKELEQKHPDLVKSRTADKWYFTPPEGESYQTLSERIIPWVENQTQNSVVVCHGGVIRTILHMFRTTDKISASMTEIPHVGLRKLYNNSFEIIL